MAFFKENKAQGIKKIAALAILKVPNSKGVKAISPFLIKKKDVPQTIDKNNNKNHHFNETNFKQPI